MFAKTNGCRFACSSKGQSYCDNFNCSKAYLSNPSISPPILSCASQWQPRFLIPLKLCRQKESLTRKRFALLMMTPACRLEVKYILWFSSLITRVKNLALQSKFFVTSVDALTVKLLNTSLRGSVSLTPILKDSCLSSPIDRARSSEVQWRSPTLFFLSFELNLRKKQLSGLIRQLFLNSDVPL